MEKYDVIVVGAGPAGAISSYYLSKKGFKVALLEKNDIGREKICGGGISHYSLNELPYGLPDALIEQRIKGINFISPKNEIFQKKELEQIGITTYRSKFDSFLVNKAIDVNVDFLPYTKVSNIRKSNGLFNIQNKFSAKYVIGADGVNSVVKKVLNLGDKKKHINLALRSVIQFEDEEELDEFLIDKETFEFYFNNHKPGYGWIFGLRNAINIGIGMKINANNPRKFLADYVKRCFKLRRKKVPSFTIEGFPIPNSKLPKTFSKDRAFLIGDAAGLVDPVSGEGVHYAIRSAKIVADTIVKDSIERFHTNLDDYYKKKIHQDIGSDLFVSYRLNLFLERFFLNNMHFWFSILKRNPFIFNYAAEIAMKSNYYTVYKNVLKKLPNITLNTIYPREILPGFLYKNFNDVNFSFG